MTDLMRLSALMLVLAAGSALAEEPKELMTAPDAVLCLSADSLEGASAGPIAKDQERLRALGCLRSPAGVRATLLGEAGAGGSLSVRFRPQGISGGITLWGRASAFVLPDGTPLRSLRAEK
ncbi:MAG: hypothetical protein QOF91_2545 [Alphaproteobacteria bacterium]|jgi:hypothetical protein|nr:hypothetical protein [Alphaproteobacteria bacterium]MEA3027260.1 hypothetical protein [Alphaproteobacteria bacterium]